MAATSEHEREQPPSYRSPWRVLARAFEKSRDRWKDKYMAVQERVKALRTEVRDLRRSRVRWQAKAEALQRQLDQLRAKMPSPVESSPPAPSGPTSHVPTRHSS